MAGWNSLMAATRGIRRLISRSFLVPKTLATIALIKMTVLGGALHLLSQKVSILDACAARKSRGDPLKNPLCGLAWSDLPPLVQRMRQITYRKQGKAKNGAR